VSAALFVRYLCFFFPAWLPVDVVLCWCCTAVAVVLLLLLLLLLL
jgi:hypothetical protein